MNKATFVFIILMLSSVYSMAQNKTKKNAPAQVKETPVNLKDTVKVEKLNLHFPKLYVDDSDIGKDIISLKYEKVLQQLNKQITVAKRRRQDTKQLLAQQTLCNKGLNYLKGTDNVVVIDSVVVDKDKFLEAYKFSDELGRISYGENNETTIFETERGNRVYSVQQLKSDSTSTLQLVSYFKDSSGDTRPIPLKGLDIIGDANYPFMLTDGMTLYFSARTDEGLGNYDIYATRYDSESDSFYKAENMGFPYNSYANDYMMVIDEGNKIGWFASDRYQPDGKVCIYTFIPNSSRHSYDYETVDKSFLNKVASLCPISSTWSEDNKQERIEAIQRLSKLSVSREKMKAPDFYLVINDLYTYTYYEQFHSEEAKNACKQWLELKSQYEQIAAQLENMRETYSKSSSHNKQKMKRQLLDLENRAEQMKLEVHETEKKVRNMEISNS